MKTRIFTLFVPVLVGLLSVSCSEEPGVKPNNVTGLRAEPMEGAVILRWNKPSAEDNVLYTSVSYNCNGNDYKKLVSNYADSLVIDGLLARYGTIDYHVCTHSADETVSDEQVVSVQCDPVKRINKFNYDKSVMTHRNITAMSASVCSAWDDSKPEYLFDGNKSTIFITPWEDPSITYPQWLDFEYDGDFNYIDFGFIKRRPNSDEFPNEIEVQVSNDQVTFKTVFSMKLHETCPQGVESYTASPIKIEDGTYKYVRFNVLSGFADDYYWWCLSEMTMDAWLSPVEVYDPENE